MTDHTASLGARLGAVGLRFFGVQHHRRQLRLRSLPDRVVARDRPAGSLSGATWLAIATALGGVLVAGSGPGHGPAGRRHAVAANAAWRSGPAWSSPRPSGCSSSATSGRTSGSGWSCWRPERSSWSSPDVSYNAMLHQISTPGTIGKVSGHRLGHGLRRRHRRAAGLVPVLRRARRRISSG